MPVTKPKAPVPASRYPPVPAQNASAAASKKKKKKKGKGKMGDGPVQPNHPYRQDQDVADEDEDEMPLENDKHRRALESEFEGLRMSTTATAQAELLAAANELYKRMESEQLANDSNDGEYWKQLPSHIRSFVETTYAHGAALTPNERSKSQAMLALAQTMVDEATNRFPAGGFPPPFDPSLLSDPKFAEKFSMKAGTLNAMNLMREYADEAYDDYVSEADEDDLEDEQRYDAEDAAQKKKKRKKKTSGVGVNGTNAQAQPLPPIIPTAPNPAPAIRRDAPSVAQPRPSSRAAGKQPVYSQSAVPPSRTTRSTATKSPVPPNPYNHGYSKSSAVNGNTALAKRPTGGGTVEKDKSKLWSTSTEEERERIKEFWLGLSEAERRDLVKLEKEAVLKKMKEQQKHSCSCAVCGRKNAIEEELEVLYDAYYEELEQYAIHQQQYQSSGGKITPPPGPGPFPGSVALDKNGAVIGAPPLSKHPTRGGVRSAVNGVRGRRVAADSADEYDDDEYDDDDDEYDDEEEDEDEDEEDEEDDPNDRKLAQRRRAGARGPPSRRANGREDFFNFGSLTAAGPGNILTVADDLLKNDGGKFLEMMEQLAERRMQRDEEAAKEVEMESDEEDEDVEGSEDEEDDDGDDDDESEEEEDIMSEEQKMEEGRKMFSIFAARMFEQRVLNAYREKVAAERQEQLLRELADEDKVQAERDAKRAKENQKKKDKKKQQKQAKEAEKAKKDAEKAAEEAAVKAKQEAMEEEAKKKREEEKAKREADRKAKEEEKARQAEERRLRIAEQKAAEAERKREKEERERKERLVRQEKEATAKAERAEREKRAKEERLAREVKEKEEREKREKEEKEKRDKERLEQQKAEEKRKQESLAASKARTGGISPSSSINNLSAGASSSVQSKKSSAASAKTNGPTAPSQRVVSNPLNRPPPMQQPSQPSTSNPQQRPSVTGPSQQPPLPIGLQLPPNMGLQPLGIPPYNPLVSPVAMSPRVGYGPPSSAASASSAFSPLAQFATTSQPPLGLTSLINGNTSSNMAYPYDHLQSPVISPPPSNSVQQPRGSGLPSALSLKTPVTPTTNGIPPIGVPPVSSASSSQAHMRRASAQANPSPFGAIGKPAGSLARAGSSSVVGEEDRISVSGLLSASKPSPPSPDRPLGSAALVDENDTIVELPKRRTAAPGVGWGDTIGPPAPVGARWGRGPQPSWGPGAIGAGIPGGPLPIPLAGPSPIGAPWSATPGRPQPGRLGSPFMPS